MIYLESLRSGAIYAEKKPDDLYSVVLAVLGECTDEAMYTAQEVCSWAELACIDETYTHDAFRVYFNNED